MSKYLIPHISIGYNFIPFNAKIRDDFLYANLRSYSAGEYLKRNPEWSVVQIGFESEIYYLPDSVIGDIMGFSRYRDFYGLDARQLANKMKLMGRNAILLSPIDAGVAALRKSDDFAYCFRVLVESKSSVLYGLNSRCDRVP
ncbi:MAG: hypothetical protein IPO35_07655 [Uliginosibacterium sp.]|nr:hypothetical protein [Uliginosibacterium sp.]